MPSICIATAPRGLTALCLILQQECSLGKVGETRFKDQCHPQSDLAVALFCFKNLVALFIVAILIMSKRYVESEIALKKENMSKKKI